MCFFIHNLFDSDSLFFFWLSTNRLAGLLPIRVGGKHRLGIFAVVTAQCSISIYTAALLHEYKYPFVAGAHITLSKGGSLLFADIFIGPRAHISIGTAIKVDTKAMQQIGNVGSTNFYCKIFDGWSRTHCWIIILHKPRCWVIVVRKKCVSCSAWFRGKAMSSPGLMVANTHVILSCPRSQ